MPLGVDTALAGSTLDGITIDASIAGTNTVEDPQVYGRGVVFGDTAHRFTAVVPAGRLTRSTRQQVADVIEAEKRCTPSTRCASQYRVSGWTSRPRSVWTDRGTIPHSDRTHLTVWRGQWVS